MTIGHRTNAIYREVVVAALDPEIDLVARAGEKLQDRRLARDSAARPTCCAPHTNSPRGH